MKVADKDMYEFIRNLVRKRFGTSNPDIVDDLVQEAWLYLQSRKNNWYRQTINAIRHAYLKTRDCQVASLKVGDSRVPVSYVDIDQCSAELVYGSEDEMIELLDNKRKS